MTTHEHDLDAIAHWLAAHPFNHWLGLELVSLSSDRAVMRLTIENHMRYISGLLHGGLTAVLLDTAIGLAARVAVPPTSTIRTVSLTTRYVAPGRGAEAVVSGTARRSVAGVTGEGEVHMDGLLVARGEAEFAVVPRGRALRARARALTDDTPS
jgi:uncharacterized protein (TIGR00369 family)